MFQEDETFQQGGFDKFDTERAEIYCAPLRLDWSSCKRFDWGEEPAKRWADESFVTVTIGRSHLFIYLFIFLK